MPAEVAAGAERGAEVSISGTSTSRVPALDGWRGLAIVSVLIGHFLARAYFPGVDWLAQAGVELFLVLSGRLMAEMLIVRRQPVGWFLFRRASRIMPTLVVYVAVVSMFLLHFGYAGKTWITALGAVGLFHNYLPMSSISSYFEHTWSLAVEEHSYLLLAAMALIFRRNPFALGLAGVMLIALALANGSILMAAPRLDAQFPAYRSDVRVASILFGFVVFLRLREPLSKLGAMTPFLAPLGLLLGLAINASADVHWIRFGIGTLCLAVAVASIELSFPAFRRIFETRTLMWFGTVSYSLYLWQQLFFISSLKVGLNSLLGLAMAIACAAWSYARIEKPARTALNGYMDQWRFARTNQVRLPA